MEILFTKFNKPLPDNIWRSYFKELPVVIQNNISRYRRWQDRQSVLLGKLLLLKGLKKIGYSNDCLNYVQLDQNRRPYLNNNIDFNVSHSDEYVVCVISKKRRVGIDIEKIKPLNLNGFKNIFSPECWGVIYKSDNIYSCFFRYWTKLESVLKADGRGLLTLSEHFDIRDNIIEFKGNKWFVNSIDVGPEYHCSITTNRNDSEINTSEIVF